MATVPAHPAWKRLVARCAGVLIAVLIASVAYADTVRVTVDRALIWNKPDGVSIVLSQVTKGAVLQMQRRVGDWYEIVLPPGSSRDLRDVGYIRASQVVVEPGNLPKTATGGVKPPPAQRVSRPQTMARTFVNIDAAYRYGTDAFTRTVPAFEPLYAEAGQIATNYGRGEGLQLDLMGGRGVWRQIGVGVGFSYYQRETAALVRARVPHPFFFNQLRDATFTTKLKRDEIAFHIPAVWMPEFGGPVKIMAFGGPAFFRTEVPAVTDVTIAESYPYDVVAITGVTTATRSGVAFGFNTGVDVAYMLLRRTVGVGGGVHYGRAKVSLRDDANATIDGDAGGLQFVVGLRYRF